MLKVVVAAIVALAVARQAGNVEQVAAEHGFDFTAQGGGKVVMLWTAGPSAFSRSALDRCLPS